MLKQYRLLSYLMGVLLCNLFIGSAAFAQSGSPVKESEVFFCSDANTAVDLFKELEVQISPDNGYWVDSEGNELPNNIFLTEGASVGKHEFTFKVTSDAYCAPAGSEFLVIVDLLLNDLASHFITTSALCDGANGTLRIDSITTTLGSGIYVYSLVAENVRTGEKTMISNPEWSNIPSGVNGDNPFIVNTSLASKDSVFYVLYVKDQSDNLCGRSFDTIKLDMESVDITVTATGLVDGTNNVVAVASGGTPDYVYEWRLDENGALVFTGDTLTTGQRDEIYYITAIDKFGCVGTTQHTIHIPIMPSEPDFRTEFFFCQNDNLELFSNIIMSDYSIEQLVFETLGNDSLVAVYEGATLQVFADETSTITIVFDLLTWLRNGDSQTLYVQATTRTGEVKPRQKITITVFTKPFIDLIVLNERFDGEYDPDDKIQLQAIIEKDQISIEDQMLWFKYYLNGQLKNGQEEDQKLQVYAINVLDFTGATNEILKLEVAQPVQVHTLSKNNVCVWDKSITKTITVPFPNAFTPDGDGINDVFLGGDKFRDREYHLQVINRWGNILYSGNEGWDGTYKGSLVTPGTYFYIVQLKGSDGVSRTIKGSVTLILKQ